MRPWVELPKIARDGPMRCGDFTVALEGSAAIGQIPVEPTMDVGHVAGAVVDMAGVTAGAIDL